MKKEEDLRRSIVLALLYGCDVETSGSFKYKERLFRGKLNNEIVDASKAGF